MQSPQLTTPKKMKNTRLIPLLAGSPYDNIMIDDDNTIFGLTEEALVQMMPLIWLNTHRKPDAWQLGLDPSIRHHVTNGSLRAMVLGPAAKGRRRRKGTAQNDFRRSAFHLDVNDESHRWAAIHIGVSFKKVVRSFISRWKKLLSLS